MTNKKIQIKKSQLRNLSREELLEIATKAQKVKEALAHQSLERYLDNAHPKQIDFHKAKQRVRLFMGGNRSGKSTAGTIEALWRLLGKHPYETVPTPQKGLCILPDFQNHLKNVIWPKIEEWCPPGAIVKVDRMQGQLPAKVWFKNGSSLEFRSHDQDPKAFEGSDHTFAMADEPLPGWIYKAVARGLTEHRGKFWLCGTPLGEPFIIDLINKAKQHTDRYFMQYVDMSDNAYNIGGGDIEEGKRRIAEFAEDLDPEEREARLHGKPLQFSGLVFKSWNRGNHLIKPFLWPHDWPIHLSIDPHPRKPHAVSFIGVTPDDTKILLKGKLIDTATIEELAEAISLELATIDIEDGLKPKLASCWIDNAANAPTMVRADGFGQQKGLRVIDVLNEAMFALNLPKIWPAPKGSGSVITKIDLFKKWLLQKDSKYGKRPQFLVFDCDDTREFVREIEMYSWDRHRTGEYKEKPIKKNDDILDSVLQVCLVNPEFKKNDTVLRYKPIKY